MGFLPGKDVKIGAFAPSWCMWEGKKVSLCKGKVHRIRLLVRSDSVPLFLGKALWHGVELA